MKNMLQHNRLIVLAMLASMGLYIWQGLIPRENFQIHLLLWVLLFSLAFVLYRGLSGKNPKYWWWAGMALRVAVLFYLPNLSDDYLRYLFDGQLVSGGINPFSALPSTHFSQLDLSPDQKDLLLSKDYYSVYPPLPQTFFGLSWTIGQSILSATILLKLFWLILEGLTLWYLPKALQKWNISNHKALIYALHPMVVIELVGNLHVEVGMVLGIVVALYAWKKKPGIGGMGLGLAAGFKLLPVIFLSSLVRKNTKESFALGAGFVIIGVIPFLFFEPLISLANVGQSLQLYVSHFAFNGSLYAMGLALCNLPPASIAQWLSGVFIVGGLGLFSIHLAKRINTPQYWLLVLTLYYLTATTVNPWYIVPVLSIGLFTQLSFPFVWSSAILLSYSAYTNDSMQVPALWLGLEYGLLFLAIIFDLYGHGNFSSVASTPKSPN